MGTSNGVVLDMLPLSERTRNALLKNGITNTMKLYEYCHKKISTNLLKGIGVRGAREIKESIKLMENDKKLYGIIEIENQEEEVATSDFSDPTLYIPIKKNKHTPGYSLHKKRIMPLDEYLNKIYQGQCTFDRSEFLNVFVNCLSEDEMLVVKYRFLLLGKEERITFEELSIKMGITGERVRQKENIVIDKLNQVLNGLAGTKIGKEIINEIVSGLGDCAIVDYSNFDDSYINGKFLSYFYSGLIIEKYFKYILDTDEKFGNKILVINKSKFSEDIMQKIINNILKIYDKKRPEDKIISVGTLVPHRILGTINVAEYEEPIKLFLYHKLGIDKVDGGYLFKKNKKELKYFVDKELNSLNKPIHYMELLKILKEKYPEYEWTEQKVMHGLYEYGKNVGEGLYVKKNHHMESGTIRSLAEKYLNEIGEPISYEQLKKYILKNRIINENSIKAMLIQKDEDVFMRFNNGNIGLKKRGITK